MNISRSNKFNQNYACKIVELNETGIGEFQSFEEQAKNSVGGINTSITNAKTAITRGVANIIDTIDKALKKTELKGLGNIISNIGSIAEKALKKSSYTKTFRFMIHGWLEYRASCLDLSRERFLFNRAGRRMQPEMMKVWEGRKAGLA